jgi:hypothetical protein
VCWHELSELSSLSELLSKFGDFFAGRGPVRFAGITVKEQFAGAQFSFEFILREFHRLVMVVRTHDLKS